MSVNADPVVLRRRAREFADLLVCDGFISAEQAEQRAAVIVRAAEALEFRERFASEPEKTSTEILADNRRLRKALVDLHQIAKQLESLRLNRIPTVADCVAIAKRTRNAFFAVQEPGRGVVVLALEVRSETTREELERDMAKMLDEKFGARQG